MSKKELQDNYNKMLLTAYYLCYSFISNISFTEFEVIMSKADKNGFFPEDIINILKS